MAAGVWVLMQHHHPAFLSWDTQKWVLKVNPSKTFPSHHISRGLNDAFQGSNVSQTFAGFSPFFYHSLRTPCPTTAAPGAQGGCWAASTVASGDGDTSPAQGQVGCKEGEQTGGAQLQARHHATR